jgi:hypothetical protein
MLNELLAILVKPGEKDSMGTYSDFEGLKKGISEFGNGVKNFSKGAKDLVNCLPENVQKISDNIQAFVNGIRKVGYYITHPVELAQLFWRFVVANSFTICLVICIGGLILYVIGIKKGAKWAKVSFFSYLSIQVFNAAMR